MRNKVIELIKELGEKNKDIIFITGDLGYNVVEPIKDNLPNQFFNGGIAEQNIIGVSAGLAKEGKIVFTYSIGNFLTLRCMEQIRNACAYNNLNVNIICVGGGFTYGPLGMSHHATEDIAMMRSLPNVVVATPCDKLEVEKIMEYLPYVNKTCYLRLGRGGEENVHEKIENYEFGKAIPVVEGIDIIVFSIGPITTESLKAVKNLNNCGYSVALYSFPTVKPIDKDLILSCNNYKLIVTVEEHNIVGGFGSAVAEVMADNNITVPLLRIALNDIYPHKVGSQDYLRKRHGIDAKSIEEKIIKKIGSII